MWDMTVVPGTYRTDDKWETVLDHSVAGTVTGGVIMKQSEEKEAAWEFLNGGPRRTPNPGTPVSWKALWALPPVIPPPMWKR